MSRSEESGDHIWDDVGQPDLTRCGFHILCYTCVFSHQRSGTTVNGDFVHSFVQIVNISHSVRTLRYMNGSDECESEKGSIK